MPPTAKLPRPGALVALGTFAVSLPIYLCTMNRSIGFMDRGEMAAAAATWGIPHATGYPTLMLLGGALVHALPFRPVLVLNVLAATWVAIGAAIAAWLFLALLESVAPALASRQRAVLALIGGGCLAFTTTWWQQANGFEAYALHCVFMPLVVLAGWLWASFPAPETDADRRASARRAFWFGLATGLSFTNHMTTLLIAPGLAAAVIARLGIRRFVADLGVVAIGFVIGLLPYAWIPFRAAMHPALDWGDPHTWRAFVHHVSGADYREWMFASLEVFARQLRFASWHLMVDIAWIGIVPMALGWGALLSRRRIDVAALSMLAVGCGVLFAANYRIPDLEPYLLTAVFGLAIGLVVGLARIAERFGFRVAVAGGCAVLLIGAPLHWRECNESGPSVAEAFFRDLVGPLPRHALLFTPLWGQAVSPAWYFQNVEGFRSDVTIVNLDLTRVSWYLDALVRREPDLIRRSLPRYREYRALLADAEFGRPYDGRRIEAARRAFLTALTEESMATRPVFATAELPEMPGGVRVPYHLALWLRADTSYVAEPSWPYAFRPWHGRIDADVAMTCQGYAESRLARALYEKEYGRGESVAELAATAARFDPRIRPEHVWPMPLGNENIVLDVATYFRAVRTLRN